MANPEPSDGASHVYPIIVSHFLSGDGMRDEIRQDIIVHMHVQLVKADKLLDRLWKHLTV